MTVAAIDIGTNSVRLLIEDEHGQQLVRHMRITRLGQGVDETGVLHPDAIARTVAVLAEYRADLTRYAVERVRATATSAARDAKNSADFFAQAAAALGRMPELITGEEEARLSFRGATERLPGNHVGPYLVIDIGGGSTEFVLGERTPEALVSVPLGCVRMTERHLHHDPPNADELRACEEDVRRVLEAQVRPVIALARAQTVVGLAGTVTSLAMMALGLTEYDPTRSHGHRLERATVRALFQHLAEVDLETRRGMLVEQKRADVIVGGAAVLCAIMDAFEFDSLVVSEHDILDGLAAAVE